MAVPGRTFEVTATLSATDTSTVATDISLKVPPGWEVKVVSTDSDKNGIKTRFKVNVPRTAEPTRPYWHRKDPEKDALNTIDDARYQGLPLPPPPVTALGLIGRHGPTMIYADCMVRYRDGSGGIVERPLAVAPAFSIEVQPSSAVISSSLRGSTIVKSSARDQGATPTYRYRDDLERAAIGTEATTDTNRQNSTERRSFDVFPSELKEGRTDIRAEPRVPTATTIEAYSVVTRDVLGTSYYYQPAMQRVSVVDAENSQRMKIGYIMGVGG